MFTIDLIGVEQSKNWLMNYMNWWQTILIAFLVISSILIYHKVVFKIILLVITRPAQLVLFHILYLSITHLFSSTDWTCFIFYIQLIMLSFWFGSFKKPEIHQCFSKAKGFLALDEVKSAIGIKWRRNSCNCRLAIEPIFSPSQSFTLMNHINCFYQFEYKNEEPTERYLMTKNWYSHLDAKICKNWLICCSCKWFWLLIFNKNQQTRQSNERFCEEYLICFYQYNLLE